ncbi:MAG: hypothetical protein IJ740_16365 [Ruminococcus sp.]|nr:hypothetical protein [Ruminococcus sp.]
MQDICNKEHAYYSERKAESISRKRLSESRKVIHLSDDEIKDLDELVSPLLKKGQSIAYIYSNHEDELLVSRRTLYRYVDDCILNARNIDLPQKVRYKKRRSSSSEKKTAFRTSTVRAGHMRILKRSSSFTPIWELLRWIRLKANVKRASVC